MTTELSYAPSAVPPGRSGEWAIDLVSQPARPEAGHRMVDLRPECFHYRSGTYRRLRHGTTTFMTDLYDEWFTQCSAVHEASRRGGRVLVTGLGLGLVVDSILGFQSSPVTRLTVVELSEDVLRLVGPYLTQRWGDRVELVQADAFAWRPPTGERFTVGWHDIWPDPHGDEVRRSVERLESWHRPHCDWQGSWPIGYQRAIATRPEVE